MTTDIQVLPDEIKGISSGNIQLYEYQICKSLEKNKVHLSKHVFSFLIDGTKRLISHRHATSIDSRSFLMIKSGNCLMSEQVSLSNNYRSVLLFFDMHSVQDFVRKYQLEVKIPAESEDCLIFTYDRVSKNLVEGLMYLQQQPSEYLDKILPLKLEEILLYLVQKNGASFLYHFLNNYENQGFVQIVQRNALNNLSMQEISFLCNMSVSTFKRNFEKVFKKSPMRWFQEQRLEYSVYLLQAKKLRPSDIYKEVGFESLSSFTQAYKQRFGTTPKQSQKII